MAKKKKKIKKKNNIENLLLDTHMSGNQFYAEFGQHMLYVTGIYLERFYNHTIELLGCTEKWSKKEKKEIEFIIEAFKLCKVGIEDRDRYQHKAYIKKVEKAIDLYKKHWFFLWN